MNYLNMYLSKNNISIDNLVKFPEFSYELLNTYENFKIKDYSCDIIILISELLSKSPGDVLNELINLEKNDSLIFEALNPSDLLMGLTNKRDSIIIKGPYCKEIYELMKNQAIEYDLMGAAPDMSILIYVIAKIKNCFSSSDKKIANSIELHLKSYELIDMSATELVLNLKK